MRIHCLGHASYLVETSDARILFDPVFGNEFDAGTHSPCPGRKIQNSSMPDIDLIVLSHRHFDHFDIATLAALPRSALICYPNGDALLQEAVRQIGFSRRESLMPGQRLRLRNTEVIATPSAVDFPEMGIAVRSKDSVLFNAVDSVLKEPDLEWLRSVVGRVDVMLAAYNPLRQNLDEIFGIAQHVDQTRYEEMLVAIRGVGPRWAIPSACGFSFLQAPWLNPRVCPIAQEEWREDVLAFGIDTETLLTNPKDIVLLSASDAKVIRQSSPYIESCIGCDERSRSALPTPSTGIPPMRIDPDSSAVWVQNRDTILQFIEGELVRCFNSEKYSEFRNLFCRWRVLWRLELLGCKASEQNGSPVTYFCDWTDDHLRLVSNCERRPNMITTVNISGLVKVLDGALSMYAFLFSDYLRYSHRLKLVGSSKVSVRTMSMPDPLATAISLAVDPDTRFVQAQLAKYTEQR